MLRFFNLWFFNLWFSRVWQYIALTNWQYRPLVIQDACFHEGLVNSSATMYIVCMGLIIIILVFSAGLRKGSRQHSRHVVELQIKRDCLVWTSKTQRLSVSMTQSMWSCASELRHCKSKCEACIMLIRESFLVYQWNLKLNSWFGFVMLFLKKSRNARFYRSYIEKNN